ncbi:gliding motility-associated C-terminal domain-containing protein [bacterium SCSIO 12643]|nr:gliding motility-associated C-terminal domain-containing protein [bacterium SCSIO 12643]
MRKVLVFLSVFLIAFSGFSRKKEVHTTQYQFVPNQGQFHSNVLYRTEIPNGLLFLENNSFTYNFYDGEMLEQLHHGAYKGDTSDLQLKLHAYKVHFLNANSTPTLVSDEKLPNHYNFYIGNDKSKWAKKVPAYERISYQNLYPNIDLVMYNHLQDGLKYDLHIAPGADASQIELEYEGVDQLYIKNGKLYVITSLHENWEEKPEAWQIIDGKKKKINCKYQLSGNTLSYVFPDGYDSNYSLIIDPVLVFSSYSGASSNNFGYTATYDKFGFLYSGSSSFNPGYPTTPGAYQTTWAGGTGAGNPQVPGTDIAITKWDTTGTFLIYSTYLGGTSDELPHSLVVTDFHELYMMGTTGSTDFPTTANAFDTSFNVHNPLLPVNMVSGLGVFYENGSDIVVVKFDSSGNNLETSTFLGGTHTDGLNNGVTKFNYADEVRGEIDLDKDGKVYIVTCTRSDDNPIGSVGFQTTKHLPGTNHLDGIIYKMNHNLTALEWTNYLGGIADDAAYSIAIDDSNNIYISGGVRSSNFPTTVNAYDTSYNQNTDAFITHITSDGTSIIESTFFGTNAYDQSYFIELDLFGNAHIFGQTSGPSGALIQNANYNDPLGGQFISKFTPELDSIIWSTRFGTGDGTPDISPTAFLVDVCSAIYLSGWGAPILGGNLSTTGLDTAGGPIQGTTDGQDFYVMVMSDDANSLLYATYFGGSANEHVDGGTSRFDRKGKVYQAVCAGCGGSSDFPTHPNPGAHSNTNGASSTSGCNLAVFKMDFLLPIVIADFDMPTTGCSPFTVTFDNLSVQQSATNFLWDFGDGNTSTQFEPTHTYTSSGTYTVKLIVTDAATCNLGDTLTREITVLDNNNTTLPDAVSCNGDGVQIGIPQNNDPNITITWSPTIFLSDTSVSNPICTPTQTTSYTLILDNGVCMDTINQTVLFDSIQVEILGDSAVCSIDAPFWLGSLTNSPAQSYHWSNFSDFSDTINSNPNDTSILVTPPDSLNIFYLQITSPLGCTASDEFQMVIKDLQDPIVASFDNPGPGCAPFNTTFNNTTDSLATTTYLWDLGNGNSSTLSNPTTNYANKGFYTVTLIAFDSSICPQSDTFSLVLEVKGDSNYTINHLACLGQDTEIGVPAYPSGATYTWIPTTGLNDPTIHNPTANITQSTTYLLVVQSVCTDSITDIVTVEPIYAQSDSVHIICSDQPTVNLKGNSNGTGVQFIWSSQSEVSDTLNSSLTDSTMQTTQTDTYKYYYFKVTSGAGCIEIDSTLVVVSDQTISVNPDSFICQLDTIQLQANNNFPYNPLDFFWSPASEIIGPTDTSTITVAPLVDTYYYLTAVNDSGCSFTDTVLVSVSKLNDQNVIATSDDDSVILGFNTILRAVPPTGYLYSWSPTSGVDQPNQPVTSVMPPQTTTYTVQVSDPQNTNCSYKNSVTVTTYEINCGEPDIFIPNAFSPNDDNENDEFLIRGKVLESLELKIYNRWGEMVFETNDLNKGWDGQFDGKKVDQAVFVYQLDAICIDGRSFKKKGNITVIR